LDWTAFIGSGFAKTIHLSTLRPPWYTTDSTGFDNRIVERIHPVPKADKKQRHKARREAKRREMRRTNSISPLKRLADAPGVVECWISTGFELAGQIQIFAYKQAAGLAGISCFLVDRGVVGLKDAWSKMNVDRGEFEGMLDTAFRCGAARWTKHGASWRAGFAGPIRTACACQRIGSEPRR
jgi:hypothetical protein